MAGAVQALDDRLQGGRVLEEVWELVEHNQNFALLAEGVDDWVSSGSESIVDPKMK